MDTQTTIAWGTFFSSVKRMFREDRRATSKVGMIQEVKMKFLFYNMIAHTVYGMKK
ncbi:MAG: hypothetical protein WBA22_01420 [Candidatus Methanofastidiosia archaeon]